MSDGKKTKRTEKKKDSRKLGWGAGDSSHRGETGPIQGLIVALEKYPQTCYQSNIKWDLIALGYQGDEAQARYQGPVLPPAHCVEGRKGNGSRDFNGEP